MRINFTNATNPNKYITSFIPLRTATGKLSISMLSPENNGPVFEANSISDTVIVITMTNGTSYYVDVGEVGTTTQCFYTFTVYNHLWVQIEKRGATVNWSQSLKCQFIADAGIDVVIHQDIPNANKAAAGDRRPIQFIDTVGGKSA